MAVFGSIALARAVAFWRACRRTLGAPDGEAPRSPGGRSSELTPDAELSLSDQTIARFVGGYISSGLKEVAGFVIIILILMVRPYGLFGEKRIERL